MAASFIAFVLFVCQYSIVHFQTNLSLKGLRRLIYANYCIQTKNIVYLFSASVSRDSWQMKVFELFKDNFAK